MHTTEYLVVFMLDQHRYALRLPVVQRVIHAVAITPLPQAPAIVLGVINVQGQVIPVVDLRQRFGLAPAALQLMDQILIVRTAQRWLALWVNRVTDILALPNVDHIACEPPLSSLAPVEGVVQLEGETVLIHNLDMFLSLDEENALQAAWQAEHDKKIDS
ncbi:MAG: chemotaxis protein CheW [Caldilineaceae bacterium]|nr:chemotaxis protein CheW [Caldilineaceae bacterium]